jgi:hypothetical protein
VLVVEENEEKHQNDLGEEHVGDIAHANRSTVAAPLNSNSERSPYMREIRSGWRGFQPDQSLFDLG